MEQQKEAHVVIVGGGFAGVAAAKRLKTTKNSKITLITQKPFFEYYPALYKLVTGALAVEVCVPYEAIFRKQQNISVVFGEYQSYDPTAKVVALQDGSTYAYDYLILAMGSETNYFTIPGIAEHAFSFKSAQEALALRDHFRDLLQESKNIAHDELVKRFGVTVVGGGPSGVELAGDIVTYLRAMTRRYHIDPGYVAVDLIESNPRVLAMLPEAVSQKAEQRLRNLGVNIYTNRRLQAQDFDEVVASGMTLQSGTVIWTAGTKIHTSFNGLPLDARNRVVVTNHFRLSEDSSVFVVGDGASMPGTGLAQGAIAHGTYVGMFIRNQLRSKTTPPYRAKKTASLIPIGHNWAILSYGKITIKGFFPWMLRSLVDFHYFTTIVSLRYVIGAFIQGAKYRRDGVRFYD